MSKSMARVIHIIAESPASSEGAIQVGFHRAVKTLRGITGLRVTGIRVSGKDDKIHT